MPATYGRVAEAIRRARACPVFYLEVPPSLFATVVVGPRATRASRRTRGSSWRSPSGTTCASARELNASNSTRLIDESQLYRIDHFLGKMSVEDILFLRCGEHHPGAGLEPPVRLLASRSRWPRTSASRTAAIFYDPVGAMRDVVQNHILQVLSLVAMEPPTATRRGSCVNDRKRDVFVAMADADPRRLRARPIPAATWTSTGVAPGSARRRRIARMRLEIDNWRWSGVPFFIRAGKYAARDGHRGSSRLLRRPAVARSSYPRHAPRPEPNQLVLRIGPAPGAQASGCRRRRRTAYGAAARSSWTWTFAEHGRRGPDRLRGAPARARWSATRATSRARTRSRRRGGWCPAAAGQSAGGRALRARVMGSQGGSTTGRGVRRLARPVAISVRTMPACGRCRFGREPAATARSSYAADQQMASERGS